MAAFNTRGRQEKEKDRRGEPPRRGSGAGMGESGFKELLSEMQDIRRILQRGDEDRKKMKEEIKGDLRDIKGEMKEIKKDVQETNVRMAEMKEEMEELKKDLNELKKKQKGETTKIKHLETKTSNFETRQAQIDYHQKEFQIRFRGVEEEEGEKLKEIIVAITAKILDTPETYLEGKVDRVFRINSAYAKRNKTPRDVIANYTLKSIRDELLRWKKNRQGQFKGKEVLILKELPQEVLENRKKYFFLTDILKRNKIKFRWEKIEGLMATFRGKQFWLTSEEKAKDFLRKHGENFREEGLKKKQNIHDPRQRQKSSPTKDINTDNEGEDGSDELSLDEDELEERSEERLLDYKDRGETDTNLE